MFFKQGNETKELSCTDIRPHDEWIDGKWITKSKEILIDSANGQEQLDKVFDGTHDPGLVAHLENSDATEERTEKTMQYSTNATIDLMEQSTATHDASLSPSSKVMELTTPDTGHPRSSKKLHKTNRTDALSAATTSTLKLKLKEELSKESLSTPIAGATEAKYLQKNIKSNQTVARTEAFINTYSSNRFTTSSWSSEIHQMRTMLEGEIRADLATNLRRAAILGTEAQKLGGAESPTRADHTCAPLMLHLVPSCCCILHLSCCYFFLHSVSTSAAASTARTC